MKNIGWWVVDLTEAIKTGEKIKKTLVYSPNNFLRSILHN